MKILIHLLSFIAVLTGILMGIAATFGLGAVIFGPHILESPPNHSTASFIFVLVVMIPAMILGAVGAIFTICLPLHLRFKVPLSKGDQTTRKLLHHYAIKILNFTKKP